MRRVLGYSGVTTAEQQPRVIEKTTGGVKDALSNVGLQ
jgi:hypothetical protein